MAKTFHFRSSVRTCAGMRLGASGYELMESKDLEKAGVLVFRKHLCEDVHAFITFELNPYAIPLLPRVFTVMLMRNKGEEPRSRPGPASEERGWEGCIEVSLPFLLWTVFGVGVPAMESDHFEEGPPTLWQAGARELREFMKLIPPGAREWQFVTSEELEAQLHDAVDKLIQYALPWLEDPETRDLR